MIRRWVVGAVVAGVAAAGGSIAEVRGAEIWGGQGLEAVQVQGPIQGSFPIALLRVRMTAKGEAALPGGGTGGGDASLKVMGDGGDASSKMAAREDEDPANLKGDRVGAVAEEPLAVDRGAAGLGQMLRKLRTRASLMMIVAHPDDEDGGMLAYESRGQGARVGMLTLTRGEGGQNVMTGDFNEALGLVRTRELLAADRYMGVDQMFGTEVDFGFSKTKEEAFAQWGAGPGAV